MNKKELNIAIDKDSRRYNKCKELVELIDASINVLSAARRRQLKIDTVAEESADSEVSLKVVINDLKSLRAEYSDLAFEIADDMHKLTEERDGSQE